MAIKKPLFCTVLFMLFTQVAHAQRVTGSNVDEGSDDPFEQQSWFMFGLNYLSDNVYLGRKDTVTIPYITPYIGYHHKSGVYAKVMGSYEPGKRRIDLLTLEAGYEHSFGDHFDAGVNVYKSFYNKKTTSIRGNSKGSASIYGQYSNDWIEPQINVSLDFNKKTDYLLGLQLDHNFKFFNKTLNIIPTAVLNSGTQHYFDEYFLNRLQKDKSLKLKQVLADAGKFKTLDYELSVKVTYRISKWLFTLIPTYAIPVNAVVITFPKQTYTEQLSNSFYLELDICHR